MANLFSLFPYFNNIQNEYVSIHNPLFPSTCTPRFSRHHICENNFILFIYSHPPQFISLPSFSVVLQLFWWSIEKETTISNYSFVLLFTFLSFAMLLHPIFGFLGWDAPGSPHHLWFMLFEWGYILFAIAVRVLVTWFDQCAKLKKIIWPEDNSHSEYSTSLRPSQVS